MASKSSAAAQLQSLKSTLNLSEPGRRKPLTRPSILYNPKTAADMDNDVILDHALSGLNALMEKDGRFSNFKGDLFSKNNKNSDRKLFGDDENKDIDNRIASYLRLLSGFIESDGFIKATPAVKTLEYLVRCYSIHQHNIEDLILCTLPYHETELFVRVVQLIDLGNSKWAFLNGVKDSGAKLPREIIVRQCSRNTAVLKAICDYAILEKKRQPSEHVVRFTTAVVFEFLGCGNISSDIMNTILFPYVQSVLHPDVKGTSRKTGALMIVTLLAQKASLTSDAVKKLMNSVAGVTRAGTKETTDFQLSRMSLMALINIVQLQQVVSIPKKVMDFLIGIRDISRILSGLSKEFNIDKFFTLFLDSLLEHSVSDESYHCALLSTIESYPMKEKDYINRIVSKFLTMRMKMYKGKIDVVSSESGSKGKQILVSTCKKYRNESAQAIFSFLKDTKMQPKKLSSSYEILSKILDESLESSDEMPNPKCLFAMEHSEAGIRKSAVMALDVADILREKVAGSKRFDVIQDAIQRRLYDDDLNVVLAILQLKILAEILNPSFLVEALQNVLQRCINILLSGSSMKAPQHGDAAFLCIRQVIKDFKEQEEYATMLATSVLPLILILPKTQRLNSEGLELAKELNWPLFENLTVPEKNLETGHLSSVNMENINKLAETFSSKPEEYLPWFVKCTSHELSKTLFLLVLLQSLVKMGSAGLSRFIDSLLPILKSEWDNLESTDFYQEQSYERILEGDCNEIIQDLPEANIRDLNCQVLACLFLKLLEALIATAPEDVSLDMLQDLFVFFTSHSTDVFKKHLEYFFTKCNISLTPMMVKLFTEEGVPDSVQVESLHCISKLCSQDLAPKLLEEFPATLVPLSSDNQDVRVAAMGCVEELSALWDRVGNIAHLDFLGKLLHLIVEQKKLIISDKNVLASCFTALLNSSSCSLLVPDSIRDMRFDNSAKKKIMDFTLSYALRLSAHAKLKILSLVKGLGSKIMSCSEVTSLLNDLLEKRFKHHIVDRKSSQKLSQSEVDVLCLLLECCTMLTPSEEEQALEDFVLKAMLVTGVEDHAVQEPCLTVLRNLSNSFYGKVKTETQECIFRELLVLFRSSNGYIQNAARDTLLQIDIDCSTVGRVINSILERKACSVGSSHQKKRHKSTKSQNPDQYYDRTQSMENTPSFLGAFLDVLLMKKNIDNRILLLGPLFKLLRLLFTSDERVVESWNQDKESTTLPSSPPIVSDSISYIQQTLLLTLENISASIIDMPQKDVLPDFDLQLLVSCIRTSNEAVTRNHVFSLITTLATVVPGKVLDHILEILTVIGEFTVTQWDSYSQRVFEDLISTIVPHWLSRTDDRVQVLRIFVNVLPQVAKPRRLSVISHVLRILGEAESLGSLLFLLFHWLISRDNLFSRYAIEPSFDQLMLFVEKQWEFEFSVQLFGQYYCTIWLRSLILVLQEIKSNDLNEETFMEMLVAMKFVSDKLQDPEMACTLESGEDLDKIQTLICDLMEQVVTHLRFLDSRKNIDVPAGIRNELKEYTRCVIKTITDCLLPSTYFKVITKLADHTNKDVRKKALGLLCDKVKDLGTGAKTQKKGSVARLRNSWLHLDEMSCKSLDSLCKKINKTLDHDDVGTPLQLAAVSAIEVLADKFPSNVSVFRKCLGSVCKRICSDNSVLSCHCLRATGALINALGIRSLSELPNIMKHLMMRTHGTSVPTASIFLSVLVTLEAVVKLGELINPYLGYMLRLVVLNPSSLSPCDQKLIMKVDSVRKLMITKIPVRLLLPPILDLEMYSDVVKYGEMSLSNYFEMLGNLAGSRDKLLVLKYHKDIFCLCLEALDLRRHSPTKIENIDEVEQNVIKAAVTLIMNLTAKEVTPLFLDTIEWSGLDVEGSENIEGKANRTISFYSFVNTFTECLRSLSVPYFKHLLNGIVGGLAESDDTEVCPTHKKKKSKLSNSTKDRDNALLIQKWHIRALILSLLHKCFLFDTANLQPNFVSTNFQVLLKPIVSQLVLDPPTFTENDKNVPSVSEVDDLLVNCVSQMAVAAGSDLLWKPLNHEVLMQTRSEKVRARIIGLRIVKQLVEKLKEEYLQFLPETIPFLGELLEDSELSVKSLAQDILKEMENMSGESLREYL